MKRRSSVGQPARAAGPLRRWSGGFSMAVVASLPLAIAVIVVKRHLLENGQWGPSAKAGGGLVSSAPFVMADVSQSLFIVPLVLFALLGWISGRRRAIAMASAVALLISMLAVGWLTFLGVGAWPTPGLVSEFLGAVLTDAGLVNPVAYLPPGVMRSAGVVLVLAVLPFLLATDSVGRLVLGSRMLHRAALGTTGLALAAGMSRVGAAGHGALENGALFAMLAGLVPEVRGHDAPFGPPPASAEAEWSAIAFAQTPGPGRRGPPLPPREHACQSAILVILETAAERDYSWSTMREAMPLTRWYLDRAIVAKRHFSSHAKSNRSDFAMLSGVYDLTDDRPIQTYLHRAHAPTGRAPGIAAALRRRDFDLRYYFPSRFTFEDDDWAIRYLGFEHVFEAGHRFGRVLDQASRAANEMEIFERAASDVRSMEPGKPFFLVLRTIIGHDPAFSPRSGTTLDPADTVNRGPVLRDVLGFVDSLLHTVVAAASTSRDSSRIAIALVGDHGVRNLRDPDLAREIFPLVSYRVPAVVSCPALFDSPVVVEHNTSHVDVAPTLGWVLGEEIAQEASHGLVMTDPRLEDRFTFVFAAKTGVDGVIRGDTITAVNLINEQPYRVLMGASPSRATVIDRAATASRLAEDRFHAVRRAQYRLIETLSRPRLRPTRRRVPN